MSQPSYTILEHRAVLTLAGPDVRSFLQGIVSNDVERVSTERALWSAFLTPQGKFLYEFFLVERPGADPIAGPITGPIAGGGATLFWLECEAERRADLMRRLKMYKLRAKVELSDAGEELTGPGARFRRRRRLSRPALGRTRRAGAAAEGRGRSGIAGRGVHRSPP
jgi:folate-binding Fe-S cluster repair protein YgfZ